jgi:UDP-N-acetylmuramoyl-L-alanyl-D-glutamate--2,6-diaminopimelate ligase
MAQEAVKQSDKVIITSDNPRFEEPQEIIKKTNFKGLLF